jgi:hypothetical protein
LLALASAGLSATACLPAGDPPVGRQVLAGRDDLPAGLLPAMPDGIVRLLVLRLDRVRLASDLYLVSIGDGGAPPAERLLAENLGWSNGCNPETCFTTDRRGRVFVPHDYDAIASTGKVTRIDAVTGEQFELGDVDSSSLKFSASGERLAAFSSGNGANVTVYESDDRATVLADTLSAAFVGDDFYYLAADRRLMRLPPNGGAPELVRAGVSAFDSQDTLAGPVLILYALTADLSGGTVFFLDPVTLQEMFPPVDLSVSFAVSPDRRWLFVSDEHVGGHHYRLVDAVTGEQERFDPPAGACCSTFEWRPGHAEVWLAFHEQVNMSSLPDGWIKEPGSPPRVVPGHLVRTTTGQPRTTFFTPDGGYFFALPPTGGPAQIGSADDPTGPRFDLVPYGGSLLRYWPLADGRLVTATHYNSLLRSEIRVIDPASGESRSLATEAGAVTVGQRRVLATAHVVDDYGDLNVIDLDSGASTLLAAEFARMPFSEPRGPGGELVTPGTHVAFQVQGRFASPHDGIWVATVP